MGFELPDWVVQFGIAGLVVIVGYKIAMKLIDKWAIAEAARTVAISDGFKAITGSHERIIDTVNEHQQNELEILNDHHTSLVALTARIETALDLTPVRGTRHEQMAKVIVSAELEEPTPVDMPPRPTPKPRAASSPGVYGPLAPKKS